MADGGRKAAAAGLPAARADGAGTCWQRAGRRGPRLRAYPLIFSTRARPGAMGPAAGARQLDGGADSGHGVRLDGRLGGGPTREPGNADSYAHVPRVEAEQLHVQPRLSGSHWTTPRSSHGCPGLSGRRGAHGASRPCSTESTMVRRTASSASASSRRSTCAPGSARRPGPHIGLNCGNGGVQ